jgi:hypothetical protein
MPKIVRLTDVQVRKIKEPGRYAIDSRCGLYLVIPPAGAATFVVRKTVDDKRTLRVLGVADRMPLAVARALAAETAQGLVQTVQEAAVTADAHEPLPIFALAPSFNLITRPRSSSRLISAMASCGSAAPR